MIILNETERAKKTDQGFENVESSAKEKVVENIDEVSKKKGRAATKKSTSTTNKKAKESENNETKEAGKEQEKSEIETEPIDSIDEVKKVQS